MSSYDPYASIRLGDDDNDDDDGEDSYGFDLDDEIERSDVASTQNSLLQMLSSNSKRPVFENF